jgi:DNA-binding transcriptional MerR regulator
MSKRPAQRLSQRAGKSAPKSAKGRGRTRAAARTIPEEEGQISIGALAKELGLSTATINFYVAEGVLPPPRKLNRTRAAYAPRHLRILRIVKRMQNVGYTLAQIRELLARWGNDEAGLKKIEGIGSLMPLPAPRNDPDQTPIERFTPVDRATFLTMLPAGVAPSLVDALERIGLMRPAGGKYDAAELWLVRNVASMVAGGVTLDEIAGLTPLIAIGRHVSPLILRTMKQNHGAVLRRELRFRDVAQPYLDVTGYLLHRGLDEVQPNWPDLFRFDAAES